MRRVVSITNADGTPFDEGEDVQGRRRTTSWPRAATATTRSAAAATRSGNGFVIRGAMERSCATAAGDGARSTSGRTADVSRARTADGRHAPGTGGPGTRPPEPGFREGLAPPAGLAGDGATARSATASALAMRIQVLVALAGTRVHLPSAGSTSRRAGRRRRVEADASISAHRREKPFADAGEIDRSVTQAWCRRHFTPMTSALP